MYGDLQGIREKVKRSIYQAKKEVNYQFGRQMNQNVDGNRKLYWKEVSKVNGKMVESCSRIKKMGGWHWDRMNYEGLRRIILRIYII